MASLLPHRDVDAPTSEPHPSARRPRRSRRLVVAGLAAAVAVPVVALTADRFADWADPFGQEVVDRSTTPLLLALQDLDQYHAASATFQVVLDQERDTPYLPSVISGERTSFLATGTVDAYVDFRDLGAQGVEVSADRRSVAIALPAPQLGEATVDPDNSRVLDRDRGLAQRVAGAVGEDPTNDEQLYAAARDKLASSASSSDLQRRAEENTREMLTTLARSMGFASVTVTFEANPS